MFHNNSPPQDFMKITLITSVIRWLMKNIKVAESYPEEKLHTLFSRRIVFHFCSLALQEDLDQHFSFCQPVSLSLRCDSTIEPNSLWIKSGVLFLQTAHIIKFYKLEVGFYLGIGPSINLTLDYT